MRALEFITGHMIYNPAYTYKFQLKTTTMSQFFEIVLKVTFSEVNALLKKHSSSFEGNTATLDSDLWHYEPNLFNCS